MCWQPCVIIPSRSRTTVQIMNRYAFLDADGIIPFAHRGGTDRYPENTMAAFAYAVGLGYRYLETDVHASSDGVLFAFHDPVLDRMAGAPQSIASMTAREVDEVRIVDDRGERHQIPRLAELLSAWPAARLNIDVKADAAIGPLAALVRSQDAIDRICVGSFSLRRLRACRRELGDGLCTSMAPSEIAWLVASSFRLAPFPAAPGCAQVPVKIRSIPVVTERLLAFCHDHELPVHVWTINDAALMRDLVEKGVDGIMSDEVALLLEVLGDATR